MARVACSGGSIAIVEWPGWSRAEGGGGGARLPSTAGIHVGGGEVRGVSGGGGGGETLALLFYHGTGCGSRALPFFVLFLRGWSSGLLAVAFAP